jgi:hypothetical protein
MLPVRYMNYRPSPPFVVAVLVLAAIVLMAYVHLVYILPASEPIPHAHVGDGLRDIPRECFAADDFYRCMNP